MGRNFYSIDRVLIIILITDSENLQQEASLFTFRGIAQKVKLRVILLGEF